ncbi:MAG TPA: PQQ-binding-like beta-propeller repeat protein [Candidatus Saccharimonadales bacterium]|nr:PQQ-binding-like beta-propeller repeat protein [Candidatus Saccharimonadales bacterium]
MTNSAGIRPSIPREIRLLCFSIFWQARTVIQTQYPARRNRHIFFALLLPLLIFGGQSSRAEWPEFRGPWGDGHVSAPGDTNLLGLPLHWSETENIKWKTAIPNRGWSTPVVMGNQVWMTEATEDGHDFFAVCVDADSGKIQFTVPLFHSENPEPLGNGASMNCYATPSPVIEPGRVFVHFGSFGTACLDTQNGDVLWKRNDLPCRHYRGPSSSLVSCQNLVILTMDGVDLQYLVALDKRTGATVWKTSRSVEWNDQDTTSQMVKDGDHRKAHSTPLIVTIGGKLQMLSAGAKAAYGYDPLTGKELWRVQYNDFSAAPRPLYQDGVAYFVTGLAKTELIAVKTDGQGDVTSSHVLWRLRTHVGKYASPLLVDGLIYTVAEQSFVTCVDSATGQVVWTERIGGSYAASPIFADGRLYFFSQEGTTTVLKPGRTFTALATNSLADGFMASPAASGRSFFLRTRSSLYRVESTAAKVY